MKLTLLCWMWCKSHRLQRIKDGFEADWIFAPNQDLDNFWTRLTVGLNLKKILNFVLDCLLDLSVFPDGILNDEIETLTYLMIFFSHVFFWISDKIEIFRFVFVKGWPSKRTENNQQLIFPQFLIEINITANLINTWLLLFW